MKKNMIKKIGFMLFCLSFLLVNANNAFANNPIIYDSFDGNNFSSRFSLTLESPSQTTLSGVDSSGVSINETPQGEYIFSASVLTGEFNDFTFDYNKEFSTFRIYDPSGLAKIVSYNSDNNTIYVDDLKDSRYSGTYEYSSTDAAYTRYIPGVGGTSRIPLNLEYLVTKYHDNGAGTSYYTSAYGGLNFTVLDNNKVHPVQSGLPSQWYKLQNLNDRNEWVAFTYDKRTREFTMYQENDNKITKYATRQFLNSKNLINQDIGSDYFGSPSGMYVLQNDRSYFCEEANNSIHRYITDGMLLFIMNYTSDLIYLQL